MTSFPEDYLLPVDKPEGPTSHDVVSRARKALGVRRIGHTGTLDPFASGLLLLCVGKATRLAEYFSGLDKTYEAEARLGQRTDTLDRDGEVLGSSEGWKELTSAGIEAALAAFRGDIQQVPPQYSAKKVGGERAYHAAREGRTVELEPVGVTIRSLELTAVELPFIRFRVSCSSGTYIRALARDIGEVLQVGAHLTTLRRTAVGAWSVDHALALEGLSDPALVSEAAVAPLAALGHLPSVEVDGDVAARLMLGQAVRLADGELPGASPEEPEGLTVAVAHAGELLAIGEADAGVLRPRKVFAA